MRKDEFPLIEAYADNKVKEVLDKLRAEIDNALSDGMIHKKTVLGIIDKYTAESAHDVAQKIVKNNGVVDL